MADNRRRRPPPPWTPPPQTKGTVEGKNEIYNRGKSGWAIFWYANFWVPNPPLPPPPPFKYFPSPPPLDPDFIVVKK